MGEMVKQVAQHFNLGGEVVQLALATVVSLNFFKFYFPKFLELICHRDLPIKSLRKESSVNCKCKFKYINANCVLASND